MQRKIKLSLILLCALNILPIESFSMSAPFGWYAEGNIGMSKVTNRNYGGSTTNSRIAGNINIGYKFMPYFGTEIGYSIYSIVSIRTAGVTAGQDHHRAIDLAAKVIFPMNTAPIEFFTKLGINYLESRISLKNADAAASIGLTYGKHHATGLFMAIGGQYYFNPQLAGVIQWQQANGTSRTGSVSLLSIGLSYLFPGPY